MAILAEGLASVSHKLLETCAESRFQKNALVAENLPPPPFPTDGNAMP